MNTHDLAFKAANGMLSFDAEGEWRLNQKEVERFAQLVRAQVLGQVPDLDPVISWLENGCNPQDAANELRLYAAAIRALKLEGT